MFLVSPCVRLPLGSTSYELVIYSPTTLDIGANRHWPTRTRKGTSSQPHTLAASRRHIGGHDSIQYAFFSFVSFLIAISEDSWSNHDKTRLEGAPPSSFRTFSMPNFIGIAFAFPDTCFTLLYVPMTIFQNMYCGVLKNKTSILCDLLPSSLPTTLLCPPLILHCRFTLVAHSAHSAHP